MDAQHWYDVIYSVNRANTGDPRSLVQAMLVRTGKREPADKITQTYDEILSFCRNYGYDNPLNFLKDYYATEYTERIPLYNKHIDGAKLQKLLEHNNITSEINAPKDGISRTITLDAEDAGVKRTKKSTTAESPEPKKDAAIQKGGKIMKPERLRKEGVPGSPIEIPTDLKTKIIKHKRSAKYYKEMSPKEREIDNRFDYFLIQSKKDESGRFFYDNKEILNENPFMGALFSDIDIEFRKIMAGIYSFNKSLVKDKMRWQDEIVLLKNYFEKKLDIEIPDDASTKRLATAIAYLMKKFQMKIFETEDSETIRILLYFKNQLSAFYNFYRK